MVKPTGKADQNFQVPRGVQIVGSAYDFEPSGDVSGGLLTATLGYNVGQLPSNLAKLSLAFYAGGSTWTDLSTVTGPLTALGRITTSTQYFSTFAVIAQILPASCKLSGPTIATAPSKGTIFFKRSGQEVTISALAANTGGQAGIDNITLKLNGTEHATKVINLTPGQSQEVTFTVTKITAGNYDVAVNELTGKFSSRIYN